MPWDAATLSAGPVISLVVSLLKKLGLKGAGQVKVAVLALGFLWMVLSYAIGGQEVWPAVSKALVAILSAGGFYELLGKPAKSLLGN